MKKECGANSLSARDDLCLVFLVHLNNVLKLILEGNMAVCCVEQFVFSLFVVSLHVALSSALVFSHVPPTRSIHQCTSVASGEGLSSPAALRLSA